MKKHQFLILSVLLSVLISVGTLSLINVSAGPLLSGSGAPTVVSYQGMVKDGGSPYTGTGYFKFALVNAAGDTTYWSNDGTSSEGGEPTAGVQLTVANGLFHVLLGDTNLTNMTALPASAFEGTDRYLRIWFSSGSITFTLLNPDQRIAAVPYALQASNADSLDGLDSADFVQNAGDTMTGTLTLAGDPSGDLDAATKQYVDALEARVDTLETLLASVSLENGGEEFVFTGVNVHVRDGSGDTDGDVNGLGNLIVGYNEDTSTGGTAARTGSHNLVLGTENEYTSYGGFVGGNLNSISGFYSSVSGGRENTASGDYSSVSGGYFNTASGSYSSISGGASNTASGSYSSISGGYDNTASGFSSSVTGGWDNTASETGSSVSGGQYNTASGEYSSVLGGGGSSSSDGNEAWANLSVVGGGSKNTAGNVSSGDRDEGLGSAVLAGAENQVTNDYASISGGKENLASGFSSSISGGEGNTASGGTSSISGGRDNTAGSNHSSVSGGYGNTASGWYSSVSGGYQRSVNDTYNWQAGTLFETE